MYLSNENRGIANYAHNSKTKKAKSSKWKKKRRIEKRSNSEENKKDKRWKIIRHIEKSIMEIMDT